jgi:hypothetical protein
MSVADFNHEDFEQSHQSEQDERLLVKFYVKAVEDKTRSKTEGRPVFKDREYIDIKIPGSRDGAARPATYRDKQRFAKHYAAFKQRVETPQEGTPLREWGPISASMCEELAFQNIKTVEQLADVSDTLCQGFMGAQTFKAKAKRYLERMKEEVSVDRLQEELASRDVLLANLQTQIDSLMLEQAPPYEED